MLTFKEVNYEMNDIRKYEDYVLKFLSFKLNYFTTYSILEYIISNGVIFEKDFKHDESLSSIKEKVKRVNKLSFQILVSYIEDPNYLNFNHIEIAFSCILAAKDMLKFKNIFPIELENIYGLKLGVFAKCFYNISR